MQCAARTLLLHYIELHYIELFSTRSVDPVLAQLELRPIYFWTYSIVFCLQCRLYFCQFFPVLWASITCNWCLWAQWNIVRVWILTGVNILLINCSLACQMMLSSVYNWHSFLCSDFFVPLGYHTCIYFKLSILVSQNKIKWCSRKFCMRSNKYQK